MFCVHQNGLHFRVIFKISNVIKKIVYFKTHDLAIKIGTGSEWEFLLNIKFKPIQKIPVLSGFMDENPTIFYTHFLYW